jgi:hypothetical protein
MKAILLGPQHAQPQVTRVLRELGVKRAATITAGWQEREADAGVMPELGVPSDNLTLHARADAVFARDHELSAAYKVRQVRLKLMQDFYRVRLAHLNDAARAISVRHVDPALLAEERAASLALVRELDRDHLARCKEVHAAFASRWSLERVVEPREQIAAQIAQADAIVIAGGHVAVLLNRLRMFDVARLWGEKPVIAWSAGAMALADQVVLFHDDPPSGAPIAEVLDAGLGFVRDLVALPNPRMRLRLDNRERVAQLAERFGARCIAMDHRARIDVIDGHVVSGAGNQRLTADGTIDRSWP